MLSLVLVQQERTRGLSEEVQTNALIDNNVFGGGFCTGKRTNPKRDRYYSVSSFYQGLM
jgi:hypothetical protein